jgi:hypothetical protein
LSPEVLAGSITTALEDFVALLALFQGRLEEMQE